MARRRPIQSLSRRRQRRLVVEGLESRRLLAGNVAVAADASPTATSLVRLVDAATGVEQASVMAFDAAYRGGVRLAMGRVTGSAAADVVAVPGSGLPGEVRVFKPVTTGGATTLTQVLSFAPFGSSYRGGLEVAVGDVDGDSVEDIIVSKSREGGDVKVFRMTNPGGTPTATLYATIAKPFGATFNGGSTVGVADVGEFTNGAIVKSVGDNKVEILVGTGAGIAAQVKVYDVSRAAAPRVADTIAPAFVGAAGQSFTGGVWATSGRYSSSGVADSIDDIVVSVGRGGGGSVQTIVYDGKVSTAANTVLKSFTPYTAAQRPNAAVFGAAVDADGNGQVDRFLVTQGDAGGPAGVANVSIAGAKSTSPLTSLVGPMRIAAPRTVFQPQTINGTVATPSPTAGVTAGASRPMQIREIVTGSGAVANTWDKLTVQYTGMLTNGTVFDTSRQAGRTAFTLTLGAGQVIAGWEAGLVGMKEGGRRLLVIPPELAYGDAARTGIPAKSTLVFDVELVSVTPNSAATITGASTGSVTEDGTTTTGGTLTVTDPDHSSPSNVQNGFRQPGSLAGTYGTFTFTPATGVWGYTLDSARAVTQALTAGQSVTDTLTVTSIDGTASRTITVTVNGAGEPASISGTSTGSLAEDAATTTVSGTLTVTDADPGQAVFAAPASLAGTYGTFAFDATTGVWGYTLDNARSVTQSLTAGQAVTDTLVVTSIDGTASRTITVTVTGAGDDASITGTSTGSLTEDGATTTVGGTLTVTDPDAGQSVFAAPASLAGTYGTFAFDATTGVWGYTLDNARSVTQALTAGQTVSDTLVVTSIDGTASLTITVTVTGAGDDASITGTSTGSLTEDGATTTVGGTLTVTDPDAGQSVFAAPDTAALVGTYGDFTFDAATGVWGYTLDNARSVTQSLTAGQTVTDTLVVTSIDGTASRTITVTITGAGDDASISGTSTGSLTEDGATTTVGGTLTVTDADDGESVFAVPDTAALVGTYGDFTFDATTGVWGYTLDNARSVTQSLTAGQAVTDTLVVTSIDETASRTITVTITGAGDDASISGTSTGSLTEDGATTTVGGTLTVTDADDGESVFAVPDTAAIVGTYGDFTFDAATGVWGYTLDNARSVTQSLTAGQEVTDTLTVTSIDETASRTITVTITGAGDDASISGTSTGSLAADDTGGTATGTVSVIDPDAGEAVFQTPASLAGTYGDFTFDETTGDWSYALVTNIFSTMVLTSDQTVTDSLTVTSADGSASEAIVVSVTGYTMQTLEALVPDPSPSEAVAGGSTSVIRYRQYQAGSGDVATAGSQVTVYYVGMLADGTIFDAALDSPAQFTLDLNGLIAGWVYGVEGMQVGEVRVLVIPPELAYGDAGYGSIPGDATLTFIVQLVAVTAP